MAWKVELSTRAQKNLDRLEPQIAGRILSFLHRRVARLDDPRSIGEALKGPRLGEFRKHRMGDYRIICKIADAAIRILVAGIGDRKEVYR